MSNKIFLKTLLLASLMLGGTSVALAMDHQAQSHLQPVTLNAVEPGKVTPTFDNSTLLSEEDLGVTITKSAVTKISQAYDVTFSTEVRAYTSGDRNVYVAVTDPRFTGNEEVVENEEDRPVYTGQVLHIEDVRSDKSDIIIPERLAVGQKFIIDVNDIANGLFTKDEDAGKVTSILIPSSIKTIGDNAFAKLNGKNVEYHIMSNETDEDIQYTKAVFPTTDEHLHWGYTPTAAEKKGLNAKFRTPYRNYGSGLDFIIGYEGEGEYDLPLTMAYYVNDETEPRTIELPITSSTVNNYDIVGKNPTRFSKAIDVPLKEGEVIDDDRIYFLNIFKLDKSDPKVIRPELEYVDEEGNTQNGRYYAKAAKSYILKDNIDNYISYKFDKITTFNGFTSINGKIDVVDGIYQKMKASSYENNEEGIKDGSIVIRTRFTSLNQSQLIIKYVNDANELKTVNVQLNKLEPGSDGLKFDFYNLTTNHGADLNFLFEDSIVSDIAGEVFSGDQIKGVEFKNFYITLDLFAPLEQRVVTKSNFQTRFGMFEIVPFSDEIYDVYSLNLTAIITMVVYAVLYILVAVGYFLYAKNRFKNDEFRRVKPKEFIKKATLGFFGLAIVILSFLFIYMRFWPLNNSIVVYNPADPLIIGFTIAGLLVTGYYIKVLVNYIKSTIEKRKTDKLKLNEDVDNDGTN